MRNDLDPTWKRYYVECGRALRQMSEGKIITREMRRKIEAARLLAYRTQVVR